MNRITKLISALLLVVLICIPSIAAIIYYTIPMDDVSYNLSLAPEDGQAWEGSKGWTVYTNEAGTIKELTADGTGGYFGLDHPGQTFYCSRKLTESLDSPMLQIGAVNRTIAVFLDDILIYTDCPDQNMRIGFLELPMAEYDRMEPISVSLPHDYLGHTLTIAQSSPLLSDNLANNETVVPCDITLYCGYAYESGIIASASRTMLPAVLLFALELFILIVFLLKAFNKKFILKLPVFALAVLLQICSILCKSDFFSQYYWDASPAFDVSSLLFFLSIGTLLLFLAFYTSRLRIRFLFVILGTIQWGCAFFSVMVQKELLSFGNSSFFWVSLPQITGFIILCITMGAAFILWKRGSYFFRTWAKTALLLIAGCIFFLLLGLLFLPGYADDILKIFGSEIMFGLPNTSLKLIWSLCLISTLIAVIADILKIEFEKYAEKAVLAEKNRLAQESYENLRCQSEETRMLIHDTSKHYALLRAMLEQTPERMASYLDELIGQVKQIRPVVTCQNKIFNILVNGKLNMAAQKGISVTIVGSDAPEKLPLTDAQMCELFINILDNAIAAAALVPEASWIRLDFHRNNRHFIFSCENSQNAAPKASRSRLSSIGFTKYLWALTSYPFSAISRLLDINISDVLISCWRS